MGVQGGGAASSFFLEADSFRCLSFRWLHRTSYFVLRSTSGMRLVVAVGALCWVSQLDGNGVGRVGQSLECVENAKEVQKGRGGVMDKW